LKLIKKLIKEAKQFDKTIVLPEAEFSSRVVSAGIRSAQLGIANIVFLGDPNNIDLRGATRLKSSITVINPKNYDKIALIVNAIYEARKSKGMTLTQASKLAVDPIYFANAFCVIGEADGIVCGAEVPTANTLRPALQIIKSKGGLVSSYFVFSGKNKVTTENFLMGDCAVVENPTAEQEAQIGEMMLEQYKLLGLKKPCCAFLSYSTLGSADSESVRKVRKAYEIFAARNPRIMAIGETQFDACVNAVVRMTKMPNAPLTRPANILIMPNLDTGNIAYKLTQYFGSMQAIGPITMGFNFPVNDLSRGCSVEDIIGVIAITVLQSK